MNSRGFNWLNCINGWADQADECCNPVGRRSVISARRLDARANGSRIDADVLLARYVGPLAYFGLHHGSKLLGVSSECVTPSFARLALTSGSERIGIILLFNSCATELGVPAGAKIPLHDTAANPGTPD